mgnify:CR=1 FL=1
MDKKKTVWLIIGLLVIIIIIAVLVSASSRPSDNNTSSAVNVPVASPEDLSKDIVATPEEVEQAQPVVEGASKVVNNVVVTPTGKPAKNDVLAGTAEAPQRADITNLDVLPPEAIKLTVSSQGFNPAQFEVKAGQLVTLGLSTTDDSVHTIVFDDPSLQAVRLNVNPQVGRAITFNTPTEAGEYSFYCDVPGHRENNGETGVMIVK